MYTSVSWSWYPFFFLRNLQPLKSSQLMARALDARSLVNSSARLLFFLLDKMNKQNSKIKNHSDKSWLSQCDSHTVRFKKKTVQVKLIWQVLPNVIRCDVLQLYLSTPLLHLFFCVKSIFWILTLSARYKKFPGVIDSARFCNFTCGFPVCSDSLWIQISESLG